jgi:replicative DNA helicase
MARPHLVVSGDSQQDEIRLPPHSVEGEQSVIGGLLLSGDAWDEVADVLTEAMFYRRDHQRIFRTIGQLCEKQQPVDAVTVSEALERNGELEEVGGLAYLGALASGVPSVANIRRYAEIVSERALLRSLIGATVDIASHAYNPQGADPRTIVDAAEARIMAVADDNSRRTGGFTPLPTVLPEIVSHIDALYAQGTAGIPLTGVSTGFVDVDRYTSGFQRGDLIIVAGRPSMGKTSFALNIAEHVALSSEQHVAVFSLEMSVQQLAQRMIGSLGRIDQHKLRIGALEHDDWTRLGDVIGKLSSIRIHVDESSVLSMMELRARARRLYRQNKGLGLIVVDYLQLLSGSTTADNRAQELAEITRALKSLAKELKVPVVALSQLNRSLEQRPNKRPILSDLRESGSLEQDGDVVLFIYRDEVYNDASPDKGVAEIIIGKQRNGPIGTVRLTFLPQHTRFENYAAAR